MILDLAVLGILAISAAVAFMRGFVREILTIGSLLGALAATYYFGPNLAPMVRGWIVDPAAKDPQMLFNVIPYEMLAPVIAFALVFGVVIVVLTLAAHLISRGVHSVGLGPVDRSLGVAFGFVRGFILIGLIGLVLNFVLSDEQRKTYFEDSKTYEYVDYTAQLMHALLPDRAMIDKIRGKHSEGKAANNDPLEPGQTDTARAARAGKDGVIGLQRKVLESAATAEIAKLKKKYNE